MDKFIYIREDRSNIQINDISEEEDYCAESTRADDDNIDDNDLDKNNDESADENEAFSVKNSRASPIASPEPLHSLKGNLPQKRKSDSASLKTKRSKDVIKKGNMAKSEYLDDMEINIIRDLSKSVNKSNELDGIDLYVRSLAVDLRKLSERDYILAKNEIQGILFKYQMSKFGQGQFSRPPVASNQAFNTSTSGYYAQMLDN